MSQRNNPLSIAEKSRLLTARGLLRLRSNLLLIALVLVLLITNGGAG